MNKLWELLIKGQILLGVLHEFNLIEHLIELDCRLYITLFLFFTDNL